MNEEFSIMISNIPEDCVLALRKIFGSDLEKYNINVQGTGIKGDGYINDMVFLDLSHGEEHISLVVKIMPDIKDAATREIVGKLYDSEILFYEKIWPTLDKFQKSNCKENLFDKIPKYYGSSSENGRRVLVMENLKSSNFILLEKARMYDKELVELLFKNLGNYHALSLALKEKNPEEFETLIDSLPKKIRNNMKNLPLLTVGVAKLCKYITSTLVGDDKIKNKMSAFTERLVDEFDNVTIYKGDYNVVTHGDSWINNFMFKQDENGHLHDVKFLDFQMLEAGTPIYDLSYVFYTGATKEILDDLEHYLHVYHSTLSSKLLEFGCDSGKLYPYESLKEEWKQYSRFGFVMGLLLLKRKTGENATSLDVAAFDSPRYMDNFDKDKYAQLTGDLVRHMFQNEFL